MGGDDLNDELLWATEPVVADNAGSSGEEEEKPDQHTTTSNTPSGGSKKRKQSPANAGGAVDDVGGSTRKKKKKQQQQPQPEQLLLQAGRGLDRQDSSHQAAFLTTALQHYNLLEQKQDRNEQDDGSAKLEILPSYCFATKKEKGEETHPPLVDRIRQAISVKKMKKWKNLGSPCVVIVCISARRAVAVLKDLASLKVRAAKLFPKNGSVSEQQKQLAQPGIGIAVGTPHRLQQLAAAKSDKNNNNNSNSNNANRQAGPSLFDKTQLVVLDCELSHKQFTVFTLPDTAPHCMSLIRESILPQMKKRKDCKIAFF